MRKDEKQMKNAVSRMSVFSVKVRIAVLGCAVSVAMWSTELGAYTNNNWIAVDGSYDGDYTNANHWSLGVVPDIGNRAVFNVAQSYKVTFPSGVFTNNAALRPAVYEGQTVEIDGSETTLVRTNDPSNSYPDETFALCDNGTSWHFFNLERYSASPAADRHSKPDFLISNFQYKLSSTALHVVKGEFIKGTYNFYDPPGSSWTAPPYMIFFGGKGYTFVDAELVFGADTSFRFPTVRMQSNASTNRVIFAGQASFHGSVMLPHTGSLIRENDAETQFRLKKGADVSFFAGMSAGGAKRDIGVGEDRRWNFFVENGARLTHNYYISHWRGHLGFDVAGEWICTDSVNFNCTNDSPSIRIVIRDGGALRMTPKSSAKPFYMGNAINCESPASFAVTNASVYNCGNMLLCGSSFTNALVVNDTNGIFGIGYGAKPMPATFKDSVITNRHIFVSGYQGGAVLDFDNTYARFEGQMFIGGWESVSSLAATATVNVTSGKFDFNGSTGVIHVGYPANRYGIFNFSGGELTATHHTPFNIGVYGNGEFNLSGGTVSLNHLRTGSSYDAGTDGSVEDTIRITGGTLDITSRQRGYGISISEHTNRSGRLIFDGGIVKCHQIWGNVGKSAFEANGGTLVAVESNTYQMYGLGEARLGEKGLTVDSSGYNITIAQSFSDKADAAGSGRLILTGNGVKTLTGDLSGLSYVEVRGGTVDITGRTVENLVLNGGTLKIDSSKPITVTGDCDFGDVYLAFTGGTAIGDIGSVLKLAKPLTSEQLEKWSMAVVMSGLDEGKALTLSQSEDGNGGYELKYEVREAGITEINLASGTETRSSSYENGASDIFSVNVAKDADLTLSGTLKRGCLIKNGDGALTLANEDNLFVLGWELRGGKIAVALVDALGVGKDGSVKPGMLRDGTLEFIGDGDKTLYAPLEINATTKTNGVIMKVVGGDVTMPAPKVTAGSFIKRGSGRLVWEIEGSQTLVSGDGYALWGPAAWPWYEWQIHPFVFDDQNGTTPTNASYGCFNVTDGEMVLRGKGDNAAASIKGVVTVGHPTLNGSVQPGLVIDNCSVDFHQGSRHLVIAPGGSTASSFVTNPYLFVTNGAYAKVDTLMVNRFNRRSDLVTKVKVADRSTLMATYIVQPNRSGENVAATEYEIFGESRLLAGSAGISLFRPAKMTFDNSILAANEDLDPTKIYWESQIATAWIDAKFFNGSEFRCSEIRTNAALTAENPLRITFDDSKWIPAKSGDFTFECEMPEKIVIAVTNVGLVLDVPADATWTMNRPVTGPGGLVKQGAGTLALGPTSVGYTGVTRIDEGAVDLDGNSLPVRVGGSGTVMNGTIANGGLSVSVAADGTVPGAIPTLSDVAVTGSFRVDAGRGVGSEPLERPYKAVAVARYEGAAPDVSRWKAVNLGIRELGGKFEAHDGVVYMTPYYRSMVISIR